MIQPSALRFRLIARSIAGRNDWQHEIGRILGVSPRTVRRWASGERSIPPDKWAALESLAYGPQTARRDAP